MTTNPTPWTFRTTPTLLFGRGAAGCLAALRSGTDSRAPAAV